MSTGKIERNGKRENRRCLLSLQSYKNTASSSGVYAHVSAKLIVLNCCSVMEMRWNMNEVWRLSSLTAGRRWSSS